MLEGADELTDLVKRQTAPCEAIPDATQRPLESQRLVQLGLRGTPGESQRRSDLICRVLDLIGGTLHRRIRVTRRAVSHRGHRGQLGGSEGRLQSCLGLHQSNRVMAVETTAIDRACQDAQEGQGKILITGWQHVTVRLHPAVGHLVTSHLVGNLVFRSHRTLPARAPRFQELDPRLFLTEHVFDPTSRPRQESRPMSPLNEKLPPYHVPVMTPGSGGTYIDVQVVPKARRPGVLGIHGDRLKIAVTETAERGRANEATVEVVADLLNLKHGDVSLVAGTRSRQKRLFVRGMSSDEASRLVMAAVDRAG